MARDDGTGTSLGRRWEFTSESVTEGHPDKLCDQIADSVLDAIFREDPQARVACEVATTAGLVLVMGEITSGARVDVAQIARRTIREVGYVRADWGLDAESCAVLAALNEQSPDIAMGVDVAMEARGRQGGPVDPYDQLGAGDQGLMIGYACHETPELMPLPITLAHRLAMRLARVRKEGLLPYLRPDGKSQVTVAYEGHRPVAVTRVVVSAQHDPDVSVEQLRDDLERHVVRAVLSPSLLTPSSRIYVNPTGRFVMGGPRADSGMTGRKIIVDTYGGMARHGGGALSGKDPTKVDRSGAYAARYLAKNIVAAGLAQRCEVQLAYVIGVARPVSFSVETFGTGVVPEEAIEELVQRLMDLRPAAIIERLQLRRPMYRPVAAYGHFGRPDLDLPWERTDLAAALRQAAGVSAAAETTQVAAAVDQAHDDDR